MRNNMRTMNAEQLQQSKSICVATVEQAEAGEATYVFVTDLQHTLPVIAHGSEVPLLQNDDQVLVLLIPQGAIVMQRLRKPGERPQQGFSIQPDGRLQLHHKHGITLKTDKAKIEIRADGRLYVDGKEIYAIADGMHRLQGATIELN
jgi:hypothetical protein